MPQQEPMQSSAADTPELSPSSRLPMVIGVIVLLLLLGGVAYSMKGPAEPEPIVEQTEQPITNPTQPTPSPSPIVPAPAQPTSTSVVPAPVPAPTPTPTPVASAFKDGTYTAQGGYTVHAGPEEITITLTLKNGVVTDTTFEGRPNLPMSQKFMDMFSSNYKPLVIGKKIEDLNLGKVSGSSYTPKGFNDAVAKIMVQAKS